MAAIEDRNYPLPLSVLMPVYNAEKYVAAATESILTQTFGDFEFIVIDDGSTDGSPSILKSYAAQDSRLRLIIRPNLGLVKTLNQGLAMARGEFIARMDADDFALKDRIALQVEYLRAQPECAVVGCSTLWVDSDGDPIARNDAVTSHEKITEILLRGRGGLCHPGAMFRRTIAQEVGGYRSEYEYAEDIDFFLRCGEHGRLANLPQCLLEYRQHFTSICANRYHLQRQRAEAAVHDAYLRRAIHPSSMTLYFPPRRGESETHRLWSGLAQRDGFMKTSRKHAMRAVLSSPRSLRSWGRLLWSLSGSVFSVQR